MQKKKRVNEPKKNIGVTYIRGFTVYLNELQWLEMIGHQCNSVNTSTSLACKLSRAPIQYKDVLPV